mgnify:CR=1 FL=1
MKSVHAVCPGGHAGAAAKNFDKIGRRAEAGAPCDLRNIVLRGQQVVFRDLNTVKYQILMQTAAGFLADQIAQVIGMVIEMGGDALVGQGRFREVVVYVRKHIVTDLGATKGGILMDQFQKTQFQHCRGAFPEIGVPVEKMVSALGKHPG